MEKLKQNISTIDGIAIGFSSIIGSGLFFLPIMVTKKSISNPWLPWVLVSLLCIPFLKIFISLAEQNTPRGVLDVVYLRFGKTPTRYLSFLLLFVTSFGMPMAALVAVSYLKFIFSFPSIFEPYIAAVLLLTAWVQNYAGLKVAKSIQLMLIIFATIALTSYVYLERELLSIPLNFSKESIQGAIMAAPLTFWAFSGWENLSFLYHRFERPKVQVPFVMLTTLIVSTSVYLIFSLIAANKSIHFSTLALQGFGDLYNKSEISDRLRQILTILSAAAVTLVWANLSAWILGLSELCNSLLNNSRDTFHKVELKLMGIGYLLGLCIEVFIPSIHYLVIKGVSAGFLCVYLACLTAYLSSVRNRVELIFGVIILVAMGLYLLSFKEGLLLPMAAFIIFLLIEKAIRNRRTEGAGF